jgi:transposase
LRLEPILPTDTRGKPPVDDRRVIGGIVHALKSGIDAPDVYGPRKSLYNGFVRWVANGVWADIYDALASAGGLAPGRRRRTQDGRKGSLHIIWLSRESNLFRLAPGDGTRK